MTSRGPFQPKTFYDSMISSEKSDEAEGRLSSAEDKFSAVSWQRQVSLHQRKATRIALVIISNNHNKIHLN